MLFAWLCEQIYCDFLLKCYVVVVLSVSKMATEDTLAAFTPSDEEDINDPGEYENDDFESESSVQFSSVHLFTIQEI